MSANCKKVQKQKSAVCVDRTHDLQIYDEVYFSLTLSQLS